MRPVKLYKVTLEHVRVLQNVILNYALDFKPYLGKPNDKVDFYYSVSEVDISQRLILSFRSKIENPKKVYLLNLKAVEAVTLLNACSNANITTNDPYVANVTEIYKNELDRLITSLISPSDIVGNQPLLSTSNY